MRYFICFKRYICGRGLLLAACLSVISGVKAAALPPEHGLKLTARWLMISGGDNYSLKTDKGFRNIANLVRRGSRYGLNGIVLAIPLTGGKGDDRNLSRLRQLKAICDKNGVAIVPKLFSAGYGGSALARNRNLAPGQLVKDALFVVHGNKAYLQSELKESVKDGGFEQFSGNRLRTAVLTDAPGKVSFQDTVVRKSGNSSLRLALPGRATNARVVKILHLQPYRSYRLSVWVKCRNLDKNFSIQLYARRGNGRESAFITHSYPKVTATVPWTKVTMAINSQHYKQLRLYMGVWGARRGVLWLDDLKVEEIGLLNVLRRPGTSITVRGENSGVIYREGVDYQPVIDRKLNFKVDRPDIPLLIPPGSRIKDGERLRVTYYHGVRAVSAAGLCMSEPETYRLWRDKATAIAKVLSPRAWLLTMDEIRAGGTCKACRDRKISMAKILGECLTWQFNLLRKLTPGAKICVWSDMLDPNHNGHDGYYLAGSSFYGSWQYIPKELIMVPWYYRYAEKSTAHFSKAGFKFIAADYYDADNLERSKIWLKALRRHPGAIGMMYTTWRNRYELLIPWLKMLRRTEKK